MFDKYQTHSITQSFICFIRVQFLNITFASLIVARLNLTHVSDESFHNIRTRALDLSGNLLAKNGCSDDAFSGLEMVLQVNLL